MCDYDYDRPDVYSTFHHRAKKKYICYECGRVINSGEKYRRQFGVWEGKGQTFKTCSHCSVAQDWLLKECNGFLHGCLVDEIEEHALEYRKMALYRLVVGIKRQWRKFKSNELMLAPRATILHN